MQSQKGAVGWHSLLLANVGDKLTAITEKDNRQVTMNTKFALASRTVSGRLHRFVGFDFRCGSYGEFIGSLAESKGWRTMPSILLR